MFVDYAGSTVPLSDGARAQVFVSAMAASSCVFACATPAQRLEDWIAGMVRALHFYGGVLHHQHAMNIAARKNARAGRAIRR